MYEKEKALILSGDFRFSAENECPFSFSAVNGISFLSAFSFKAVGAENEKCFSVGLDSSIHHKKILVLVLRIEMQSLGLGLEH